MDSLAMWPGQNFQCLSSFQIPNMNRGESSNLTWSNYSIMDAYCNYLVFVFSVELLMGRPNQIYYNNAGWWVEEVMLTVNDSVEERLLNISWSETNHMLDLYLDIWVLNLGRIPVIVFAFANNVPEPLALLFLVDVLFLLCDFGLHVDFLLVNLFYLW